MYYQLFLTAAFAYASGAPLSLAAADARTWAIDQAWSNPFIRLRNHKLELELYAAGLS